MEVAGINSNNRLSRVCQWVVDNRVAQIALVALAVAYLVRRCCAYKPTTVNPKVSDPERLEAGQEANPKVSDPGRLEAEQEANPKVSDPERLEKYREEKLPGMFFEYAVSRSRVLGIETNESYSIRPQGIHYCQPVKFDGDNEHPVEGLLYCSFELMLLGKSRQYNMLLIAQEGGPPIVHPMNMGTSNAGPYLQDDIIQEIIKLHDDIKYIESEAGSISEDTGIWSETWRLHRMSQTNTCIITFTPDDQGGTDFSVVWAGEDALKDLK